MPKKVVFLNSVFPCLSETFIFDQFERLRAAGLPMVMVSSNKPAEDQVHPRMRHISDEVIYLSHTPLLKIIQAHVRALVKHPGRYLRSLVQSFAMQERWSTTLAQLTGAVLVLSYFDNDEERPHLHVHFTYGAASVAFWAHRIGGIPFSMTLHGADLIFDQPPDLEKKLVEAGGLVSISRFNIEYIQEHFPHVDTDKITIIPLGVPVLDEYPDIRPETNNPFRILHVGRLSDHKAQHFLIDACNMIKQRGYDFECWIVGEGPKREALEQQIQQLGIGDRVKLLGPRYHDEVLALYGQTDLFVLSSITEGMPVVIMEAMQMGIPVVAPAISGIPEMLEDGHSGVLAQPADAESLAEAVIKIMSGEIDRAKLAEHARAFVVEKFDLQKNTMRFKEYLERY